MSVEIPKNLKDIVYAKRIFLFCSEYGRVSHVAKKLDTIRIM